MPGAESVIVFRIAQPVASYKETERNGWKFRVTELPEAVTLNALIAIEGLLV